MLLAQLTSQLVLQTKRESLEPLMVHKLCITLLFLFYRSSPSGKCDISDEVVAQVRNAEMTHKNLRFAAESVGILIFFKLSFYAIYPIL